MAGFGPGDGSAYYPALYLNIEVTLTLIAGAIFSAPVAPALRSWLEARFQNARASFAARSMAAVSDMLGSALLALLLLYSVIQLSASTYNPFIYFRF